MKEANIPHSGLLYYMNKEDVLDNISDPDREAYLEIFSKWKLFLKFLM